MSGCEASVIMRKEKGHLLLTAMKDKKDRSGKIIGVILGAGKGTRMPSSRGPKQFLDLGGKPVFLYSIKTFDGCPSIDEIVVVVPPGMTGRMKCMLDAQKLRLPTKIIVGGKTRQDSSFKAVERLARRGDVALVAIHDAARPLVTPETVEKSIREAKQHGAAAVATRTTDTVLKTNGDFIVSIPDRESLFNAQTPQVFRLDLIWEGHRKARRDGVRDATDDVQLVLRLGKKVKLVEGPPENMKVTTGRDLDVASLILRDKPRAKS